MGQRDVWGSQGLQGLGVTATSAPTVVMPLALTLSKAPRS